MSLHLRDYQVDAIAEVNSRWQSGEQRVLLALPTGAGKTELGISAASRANWAPVAEPW